MCGSTHFALLDLILPVLLLVLLPMVALARDPAFAQKWRLILFVPGVLLGLLLMLGLWSSLAAVPQDPSTILNGLSAMTVAASVLLISPLVAFSFGTVGTTFPPTAGLAAACAVSTWIGLGVRNFPQMLLSGAFDSSNGNDLAPLILRLFVMFYLLGLALSAVGGLLGATLRLWLVRRANR